MNIWLIYIVGLIYLTVSVKNFYSGDVGSGILFLSYATANVGLILMQAK